MPLLPVPQETMQPLYSTLHRYVWYTQGFITQISNMSPFKTCAWLPY